VLKPDAVTVIYLNRLEQLLVLTEQRVVLNMLTHLVAALLK